MRCNPVPETEESWLLHFLWGSQIGRHTHLQCEVCGHHREGREPTLNANLMCSDVPSLCISPCCSFSLLHCSYCLLKHFIINGKVRIGNRALPCKLMLPFVQMKRENRIRHCRIDCDPGKQKIFGVLSSL